MAKGKPISSGKQPPVSQIFAVKPAGTVSATYMQKYSTIPMAPYYWGDEHAAGETQAVPPQTGNTEAGELIGDGSMEAIAKLVDQAVSAIEAVFHTIQHPDPAPRTGLVELRLAPELARWKRQRQGEGLVLPCKGHTTCRAPPTGPTGPTGCSEARIGLRYICGRMALEKRYLPFLSSARSAKFDRKTAQCIMFVQSSMMGLAAEAIMRGYDAAAVSADMVFNSPVSESEVLSSGSL